MSKIKTSPLWPPSMLAVRHELPFLAPAQLQMSFYHSDQETSNSVLLRCPRRHGSDDSPFSSGSPAGNQSAIPWTARTSCWHWPRSQKDKGERGSSGRISSEEHVGESGASWSHLQESPCRLMSHVYPLLRCWSQLSVGAITRTTAWIQRRGFNTSSWREFIDLASLLHCEITMLSSLLHRYKGEEENGGNDSSLLCGVVVVLWRQSCQMVVNLWQQGRLFVWILFRLTSQVCALSLGVDVFLNGGRCIDKVLWPGQKGVNQEVTLTVRGTLDHCLVEGKHTLMSFSGLVQFSSNFLDIVSLFVVAVVFGLSYKVN